MSLNITDYASGLVFTNNNGVSEVTTGLPFAASKAAAKFLKSSSQSLSIADSATVSFTSDLTIAFNFKWASVLASDDSIPFVAKYGSSGNRSFAFYAYAPGGVQSLRFAYSDDGTNVTVHSKTITPSADTWYHYAMSFDASAHQTEFMVDGSSLGTDNSGTRTSIYDGSAILEINKASTPIASSYFDGYMDNLSIWNITKTAAEINALKAINLTGQETGHVIYIPFETLGGFKPRIMGWM